MLLSRRHKFLFIHVPKTAGTTVSRVFAPHARLRDRLVYGVPLCRRAIDVAESVLGVPSDGYARYTGFNQHVTYLKARSRLGLDYANELFKFAFVRNPWDWFVSQYEHVRRDTNHVLHDRVLKWGFSGYVKHAEDDKFLRQFDFVRNARASEVAVDFVGRYESLDADIDKVMSRLGFKASKAPHLNKAPRPIVDTAGYFNDETYDVFWRKFAVDVETFGYPKAPTGEVIQVNSSGGASEPGDKA